MYVAIKYVHVTCAILSGTGFLVRGVLMMADSPLLARRWIKIVPHINDTLLLAAALAMMVLTSQYPFVVAWVTAKVFGLIGYIMLGSLALKAGRNKRTRIAAWLGALALFGYIVSVALTKDPWGLVRLTGG